MMTSVLAVLAIIAASIFPAQSGSIPSVGTLLNPGFELIEFTNTNPPIAVPQNWVQGGVGNETHPTVRSTTDQFHSGSRSAQFTPRSVTGIDGQVTYVAEIWQQVSLIEAGQLLTLSFWVKYGQVPEGADPSPSGTYNFTVHYEHDHDSVQLNLQSVSGSATAAGNYFFQYVATFLAPVHPEHHNAYLTLTFSTYNNSIYIYLDDIVLSAPLITGDPQFVGLRGQSYQVHGIDGAIYNLISSESTQVNAAFKFLSEGECPVFQGIPDSNCWSHPGSYLGAIGIQQYVNNKRYQLEIVAGAAAQGFAKILLDGEAVNIEDSVVDGEFSVTRSSSHRVTVQTPEFIFTFDNSDMFINQAVAARVPLSQLKSHGLFGQTHARKIYPTAIKYIEGEVDDYMIEEGSLFGNSFVHNKFQL